MATDSSAGSGCVAFSASGEPAGAAASHGRDVVRAAGSHDRGVVGAAGSHDRGVVGADACRRPPEPWRTASSSSRGDSQAVEGELRYRLAFKASFFFFPVSVPRYALTRSFDWRTR
jgi:hypothetical protein